MSLLATGDRANERRANERRAPIVVLVALALILVAGPIARAQHPSPRGEPPTRGVEIPAGPIAGDAEAIATVLNPANLGFLKSWSLQALDVELGSDGTRGPGGTGFYAATPMPWLKQLAIGVAVESIRPPDQFPYLGSARLAIALAWHPVRALSIGANYSHVFLGATPGADHGIDTVDLTATARLGAHVALAMAVHDLPAPQYQGLALQRVYQPEITYRPLGTNALEFGFSARIGERRGDWRPMLRIDGRPVSGLVLRGALEWVPNLEGVEHQINADLRATVGLELNFARFGFGGYALFGSNEGAGYYHGFAVTARVSGDRYPSLARLRHLDRIDFPKGGDRALAPVLAYLHRLERDKRAEGIVAVMGPSRGSWATMEELRGSFARLRAKGKHVYVYAADLDTKSYYAAIAAERIFLDPAGGVRLTGMSSTGFYFKGTFDKLGVQADFVKIAEYKSAPEQFTRSGPSEDALVAKNSILDDISGRVVAAIAEARKQTPANVIAEIDRGPFTAGAARAAGLVDELKNGDEIEEAISTLLDHRVDAKAPVTTPAYPVSFEPPAIAALFIEGDIVEGKSRTIPLLDMKFVGHESILGAINEVRSDSRIKALVVRINSPGGSALASDLIARELTQTRKIKPVICSLGDTAASGGYFIAAGCDLVFAEPSTITGSIGIFSGKFDVSGLARLVGVSVDTMKRGAHADIESWFRPYTDEERAHILGDLRYSYDRFLDAVASARGMTREQVDAVGRGRVWTGAEARARKLVDRFGGFMEAVEEAKARGGLGPTDDAELIAFPREATSLLSQVAQLFGISLKEQADVSFALPAALLELVKLLPASLLADPSTPQARMIDFEPEPRGATKGP